jgi:multiple sugar transport system permease protein
MKSKIEKRTEINFRRKTFGDSFCFSEGIGSPPKRSCMNSYKFKVWLVIFCLSFLGVNSAIAKDEIPKKTIIKTYAFFNPNNPESAYTRQIIDFTRKNPDIEVQQWGGIAIPGGGRASLMMAIAGKTAPDIGLSWFHTIRNEIKQQFLYPLNEWIGEDTNGNGQIDDEEARWPGWKNIPLLWRKVATINGKVYGIPIPIKNMTAILFRVDMVKAAGLNPNKPPRTWDEFYYWCQKLTDPNKNIPGAMIQSGQKAICLSSSGYLFLPWIQSGGGKTFLQFRTSPKTGKKYAFPLYETKFITPEGENLSKEKSVWKANFASEAGLKAADFIYKLRWGKWLVDPETKEPVTLSGEDISNGFVMLGDRKIEFSSEDIIKGIARMNTGQRGMGSMDLLGRGEVAMTIACVDDLKSVGASANIDPSLLSWFPFPAAPVSDGEQVVQIYNHYGIMYTGVGERPKAERNAIWKTLTAICDKKVTDNAITAKVLEGLSRFVSPVELKRLGYEEYIRDIPVDLQRNFTELESGKIKARTEPWAGFWFLIDTAISRECFSIMLGANGEDFDYREALKNIEHKANSGLMFKTPQKILDKWRPLVRGIVIVVLCIIAFFCYKIIRSYTTKNKDRSGSVYKNWLPVLLVAPAILIILTWRYYPLIRGMFMAFQDYKIAGDSAFVGLDNFIILLLDSSFWMSLLRTCYFVFLNMFLAFTAPILLAILLTEVPRFKIFFRTLFFLPQMTSGIVIALMWKLMYNPTPAGFFNQIISILNYIPFVHIEPQTWLQDPKLAMICCVLPTVWASMGMASLIYLAALHSVPKDLYEAAEVDGAGIRHKLLKITLPSLLPLIIINFVGTFIGTFQNMGNIFLLTFGGPGETTTVVGLKIWIEAYNNLRFSMATSMAWILGSLLIGLTFVQIQFLKKVEYKRAAD